MTFKLRQIIWVLRVKGTRQYNLFYKRLNRLDAEKAFTGENWIKYRVNSVHPGFSLEVTIII